MGQKDGKRRHFRRLTTGTDRRCREYQKRLADAEIKAARQNALRAEMRRQAHPMAGLWAALQSHCGALSP